MRKILILCGWILLGSLVANSSPSGCLSVTPSVTPASSCDSAGAYLNSCPCDKYLDELTVIFTGQTGANVFIYKDKDHHDLLMSFTNAQHGDLLTISDGGKHLKKKLYLNEQGMPDAEVDTDCKGGHNNLPGIEVGQAYGDFTIAGYVDE